MPEIREPGKAATLPVPEINPLHHPVLRQNLERWAEVYFGNRPEKRDVAVLQLLRELESSEARANGSPSARAFETPNPADPDRTAARAQGQPGICEACGFVTRPNQRFCGRCGARLITPLADALDQDRRERAALSAPAPSAYDAEHRVFPSLLSNDPQQRVGENSDDAPEESWEDTEEDEQPSSTWYSYRIFIGLALAVLLGYLGYLAWRSSQGAAGGANLPQQAPASSATSANPPHPPADHSLQNAAPSPSSNAITTETPFAGGHAANAQAPAHTASNAPSNSTDSTEPPSASPGTGTALGNGTDELATAEKLLNAPAGKRDSAQAADLLWKAVSKKNTGAMVTLAELYLRGDGVQKNCDQGRILLDAAAKKGSKEAGELLRNLPGFGCE